MTKLKTKLRSSSSRREKLLGTSKPALEDEDALKYARTTSMNATVNVADDVEEVFYAHTAPTGRTTDVVYRTTEQLRGTNLEPLAEDHVLPSTRSVAASEANYVSSSASEYNGDSGLFHPPALGRGFSAGPPAAGQVDALRAELAAVKSEVLAIRREMMNEMHTLRYDVLKEVTMLKGAISQLVAAVSVPRADSPSAGDDQPLSADVRRAITRSPSVVTSKATKARLAAARPPSASNASSHSASTGSSSRASSRLTQLAPVNDDVLSAPLRTEQLDELFPIVDPWPDAAKHARNLTAGTREWAMDRVQDWLDSRFDVGRDTLLAVVGDGGAGKSTFAGRVCEHFAGGNLLAAHLCKFDRKAKSQPRVALLSLVRQIVKHLPDFKRQLARLNLKYVLEEPDPFVLAGKLLVDPLAALEEPITPKFLLIDGLDQCRATALASGHPDIHRNELLNLLAQVVPQLPKWLGVLVTSKPMPELARALKVTSVLDFSAANAAYVADARFLVDEIVDTSVVAADREPARAELERKSGGNMAYLEFTRRALAHPMTAVMNQLEDQTGAIADLATHHVTLDVLQELPESLYEIYMEIFEDKFGNGRLRLWRKVQPLLSLIVTAASGPYSLVRERAARELLQYSSDDIRLIRRSFVDIISLRDDGVFRIESSSLFDWLSDASRAHESFFVDTREGLAQLKKLQALSRSGSSSSSSSSSTSSGGHDKARAVSRRTDSARSTGRFDPPANPNRPVGILKRGGRS